MGEDKEDIKTKVSSEKGTQMLIQKSDYNRATKRACTCKYCFHYIFVNLRSATLPFLPKVLSSLNASFFSLKFLQRD